jgi:hypothetical protein
MKLPICRICKKQIHNGVKTHSGCDPEGFVTHARCMAAEMKKLDGYLRKLQNRGRWDE